MTAKQYEALGRWMADGFLIENITVLDNGKLTFSAKNDKDKKEASLVTVSPLGDTSLLTMPDRRRRWASQNLPGYHVASFTQLPLHAPAPHRTDHYRELAEFNRDIAVFWMKKYYALLSGRDGES